MSLRRFSGQKSLLRGRPPRCKPFKCDGGQIPDGRMEPDGVVEAVDVTGDSLMSLMA